MSDYITGLFTVRQLNFLPGIVLPEPRIKEIFQGESSQVIGWHLRPDGTVITDTGAPLPPGYVTAKNLAEILEKFQKECWVCCLFEEPPQNGKKRGPRKVEARPSFPEGPGLFEMLHLVEAFQSLDSHHKVGVQVWENPTSEGGTNINVVLFPDIRSGPSNLKQAFLNDEIELFHKTAFLI